MTTYLRQQVVDCRQNLKRLPGDILVRVGWDLAREIRDSVVDSDFGESWADVIR